MSLIRLHERIVRPNAVRKTLLLLSVVGALMVGLLAMHTIASTMGDHSEPASAAAAMVGAEHHGSDSAGNDANEAASAGCTGLCDPGHSMSAMACILALLFAGALVAWAGARTLAGLAPRAPSGHRTIRAFAANRGPAPPDLDLLSISRT